MVQVISVDRCASFRMAAGQFLSEVCGINVIAQVDSGGGCHREMALRLASAIDSDGPGHGGINGIESGSRINAADDSIKVSLLTLHNGREYCGLAQSPISDRFVSKTGVATVISPVIESL